jgi:hypothetical protein
VDVQQLQALQGAQRRERRGQAHQRGHFALLGGELHHGQRVCPQRELRQLAQPRQHAQDFIHVVGTAGPGPKAGQVQAGEVGQPGQQARGGLCAGRARPAGGKSCLASIVG